ncbi:MAG: hypothetical protein AAF067_07820, partial [Pseudomonadota bacterium]
ERFVYTEDVGSSSLSSPTISTRLQNRNAQRPARMKRAWRCLPAPAGSSPGNGAVSRSGILPVINHD